jgi:hypothetical protein
LDAETWNRRWSPKITKSTLRADPSGDHAFYDA